MLFQAFLDFDFDSGFLRRYYNSCRLDDGRMCVVRRKEQLRYHMNLRKNTCEISFCGVILSTHLIVLYRFCGVPSRRRFFIS